MKTFNKNHKYYWEIKLKMILITLVIIGGLNYGTTAFGYNMIELLSMNINNLFKSDYKINKIIYITIAISAGLLSIKKTTWLPFLGKSVLPATLIPLKTPSKSNMKVSIKTKPNVKVAYWAALPKGDNHDVVTAYGDFSNSGVVMSDSDGIAELPILSGSCYTVPSGRKIGKHVHYRVLGEPYGMIDKINTIAY